MARHAVARIGIGAKSHELSNGHTLPWSDYLINSVTKRMGGEGKIAVRVQAVEM